MADEETNVPEEPPERPIQEANVKGVIHLEETEEEAEEETEEEPENEDDQ